ncbi:MAG: helix-turn-helix domain-containing protein [Nitrospiraceae bacterium]|nr:helix-turn-helix domain-containing protein [Nitrospiraceae bacterium]
MKIISQRLILFCMTPAELKKWREEHGYSQGQLARALEVHVMTVSRWERGFREIPSFLHLALECISMKGTKTKKERRVEMAEEKMYTQKELKEELKSRDEDVAGLVKEFKRLITKYPETHDERLEYFLKLAWNHGHAHAKAHKT